MDVWDGLEILFILAVSATLIICTHELLGHGLTAWILGCQVHYGGIEGAVIYPVGGFVVVSGEAWKIAVVACMGPFVQALVTFLVAREYPVLYGFRRALAKGIIITSAPVVIYNVFPVVVQSSEGTKVMATDGALALELASQVGNPLFMLLIIGLLFGAVLLAILALSTLYKDFF